MSPLFGAAPVTLYEAGKTPGATVEKGKVVVTGAWDLSDCGRIDITFSEPCRPTERAYSSAFVFSEGSLLLENPGAVPPDPRARHSEGSFWAKVCLREGATSGGTPIPPAMPELEACISKMTFITDKGLLSRVWPSEHWGSGGRKKGSWIRCWTLDPSRVSRLTFTWPHGGEVVRIVASGPANRVEGEWPAFAKMSPEAFFPFIDKFGQFKWYDWPGKVHSDAEMAQSIRDEDADLAAHPGPKSFNRWGGWKDGPRQEAKGHFYVKKVNGMWWFVDPDGCLWWSQGPVRVSASSAMTFYPGRETYFDWLPPKEGDAFSRFYRTRDELMWPYWEKRGITNTFDFSAANLYRKYGERWHETWAERVHVRLRSWGANTIANSSDAAVEHLSRTPYIERFEIKSRPIEGTDLRRGWWPFRDPFDPSFAANVRAQLKERAYEVDDPWCVGFFVDNELPWSHEDDTHLARIMWASPEDQPGRTVFVRFLREKYGKVPETPSEDDFRRFTRRIADRYFREIRAAFDEVAPKKLYLGCRGMERPFIAESAEPYVDAMSQNWYGDMDQFFHSTDPDRFYCCSGLAYVDKPIIIGEFHFGAKDRGPFSGTLRTCADQAARAQAYRGKLVAALEHPRFIGAHWHQYSDQPTAGRFDGEAMQNGWTDVCDTPYPETIEAVRWVGENMYRLRWEAGLRLQKERK